MTQHEKTIKRVKKLLEKEKKHIEWLKSKKAPEDMILISAKYILYYKRILRQYQVYVQEFQIAS